MSQAAITAIGAAAPSWRLPATSVGEAWGGRGRGEIPVPAADEDALTLGWAAGRRALAAADADPADVDGLWWGTSRPPFAEGPSWAMLAAALRLGEATDGALLAGSPSAGLDALLAAVDAIAAGRVRRALVVASDALVPGAGTTWEARTGGAGAAVVVEVAGPATVLARVVRSRPVIDRYRGDREVDTRDLYDPRLFREQVFVPLVTEVGRAVSAEAGDVRAWTLPDPDGRLGAAVARKLGADPGPATAAHAAFGDTGAAAPLLGLLEGLAAAGRTVALGYGGGRCVAVALDVRAPVPGASEGALAALSSGGATVPYAAVLRARGQLVPNGESVPMGVPPTGASLVREAHDVFGFRAAACVACGQRNVPAAAHPVCGRCGGDKLEESDLALAGTIHTFIVNHTMPAPFVAPLPLLVIDLDDGARVQLQGMPEDASSLAIGDRVVLELRRYAVERGAPVYGYKARKVAT